jgi:TonB family protein
LIILVSSLIKGQIVKGKVSLRNNDNPAIGAIINVKDTNNAVITDLNGNYQINIDSIHSILCYRFIGFKSKELKVGDTIIMNVILEEEPHIFNTLYLRAHVQSKTSDIIGVRRNASSKKIDSVVIKGREFKVLKIEKFWDDIDTKVDWKLDIFNKITYPDSAIFEGIEGTVYVKFMIGLDGNHKQLEVVKGVHKSLDCEVLKSLNQMSKWTQIDIRNYLKYSNYCGGFFILPVRFKIYLIN